jgi:hypothetical protein
VALELLAGGALGEAARGPLVARAWDGLLPRLLPHLAAAPRALAARISNALCNLAREGGEALAERWGECLVGVSPAAAAPLQLLEAGLVLAWRCGLAHFRDSALARWRALPAPLRRATLGLPPEGEAPPMEALARGLEDPWFDPARPAPRAAPALAARVGGFRGFGGRFVRPPRLARAAGAILASDGEGTYRLHADVFGATLRPVAAPAVADADAGARARIAADGTVSVDGTEARLPALAGAASLAAAGTTLAVALAHSHHVYVVALPGGGSP